MEMAALTIYIYIHKYAICRHVAKISSRGVGGESVKMIISCKIYNLTKTIGKFMAMEPCPPSYHMISGVHGLLAVGQFAVGQFAVRKTIIFS